MKKFINTLLISAILLMGMACKDYLDVVPDNIPTLDHAFRDRTSAEKYLFTCYSYLPRFSDNTYNPAAFLGHECWIGEENWPKKERIAGGLNTIHVALFGQNKNNPYLNFWDGGRGGSNLFIALRDCNIFLENIDNAVDLEEDEKNQWISEVKFLKAYYHFYLLRMYGAIPIIKENLPIGATPEQTHTYREPIDDVVNYIVELLDEALSNLPDKIENETQYIGRITKSIALALKAKTLVLSASPIFNGNEFYANIKDNKGRNLFPTEYDPEKWKKAAEALKEAISFAESQGAELAQYTGFDPINDITRLKLDIRSAVTERWNPEIIWGSTDDGVNILQRESMARFYNKLTTDERALTYYSPTLQTVERFYTNHGVPITEDKFWDYQNRYQTSKVTAKDKYYMKEGYTTAKLNFDREPRYYASLCFDGCIYYGNGIIGDKDYNKLLYCQMKKGQVDGMVSSMQFSETGYYPKKLVSIKTTGDKNSGYVSTYRYSFPMIRLADLYLLYAEVLNEVKTTPDTEVYEWIDKVRERAGLEGVVESWSKYSNNPEKVNTQKGMREIIHQERLNELAFEYQAYWDILRWKEGEKELNTPIQGWNVSASSVEEYYKIKTHYSLPRFSSKHYLFPIKQRSLDVNENLVQNLGW